MRDETTKIFDVDYWAKTVADKEYQFVITRTEVLNRHILEKIIFKNSCGIKGGSRHDIFTDNQLSREQVEELFKDDLNQ